MSWRYWDDYKRPPRRPADGIKARAQRGQFGKTWWASRWIAALERLVDAGRLSRGRSYARSGQVVKLEVGRAGVAARVQGSRPTPYAVTIRFRPLSDAEWNRVADAMAAQALYAAKLLSGEMPAEIEEVFAAAGVPLFPAQKDDLKTDCSCPDWANPCKHVAAVHYLLGEQFDADPFLIFELRGRTKAQIAEALRARRSAESSAQDEDEAAQIEEKEEVIPLAETLDAFWQSPAGAVDLTLSFQPPAMNALPIKRLGAPSFWQDRRDFAAIMGETYEAIGRHARHLAMEDA